MLKDLNYRRKQNRQLRSLLFILNQSSFNNLTIQQSNQIAINSKMKARKARSTHSNSSLSSFDCSCQILYDSDLSQVSDSQCLCNQCLQAKLQAFNDFSNVANQTSKLNHKNKKQISQQKHNGKQNDRNNKSMDNTVDYKPTKDKKVHKEADKQGLRSPNQFTNMDQWKTRYNGKLAQQNQYQQQQLNDFVLITKNRTRQFLKELKKNENLKKEDQQKYRQKIAHNLEMLRYTAKIKRARQQGQRQGKEKSLAHQYKWNHSKFPLCHKKQQHTHQQCCAFPNPDRLKKSLDTNLNAVISQFQANRSQILEEAKKKRVQKLQPSNQICPYDHCQNHHMRTSKTKLAQIQRFMGKQVKAYKQKKKRQKLQIQNKKKIKEAKLRAIDLKCKKIVERSKKNKIDEDRTSFHLTIDNYDTFSQLRDASQQRKLQKEKNQKIKQMVRNGGGNLQQAIYEDAFEDDQLPKQRKQERKVTTKIEKVEPDNKILKEARIYSPKKLKEEDEHQKLKKTVKNQKNRTLNMAKLKEEEKRKERIEREIIKKKEQIMKQFDKRNTHAGKQKNKHTVSNNKRIREQYQQKVSKPNPKSKAESYFEQEKSVNDTFRNVYKHVGKRQAQIEASGDPLMQEYLYHEQLNKKNAAEYKGQKQLFSANIHSLMKRKELGI